MTDLESKADAARAVVRAGESPGQRYRLEDTELTEASAIGESDGFPKFGDFLDVTAVDANGAALGPRWVECPGNLARQLVEAEVSAGDTFAVQDAAKSEDGAWTFEVTIDD